MTVNIFMTTPHCLGRLVVKKDSLHGTETWLCLYGERKKKDKKTRKDKKWQELMRRRCFISVISTGYKLYFLSILINVKLFEENHPEWTKIPQLDSSGFALTVARFESFFFSFFFVYLFCLFMQRHMWWMNTLFKLQGCLGERLSTRKWAENSTAGSF